MSAPDPHPGKAAGRRGAPVFLARRAYRQRRLADAARLLPVLGTVLLLMPILWAPGDSPGADTARDALYVFALWAGLILAAFLLSRRLTGAPDDEGDESEAPPAPAGEER